MTQNEIIGKNISHFRKILGLSQDELADYLDISRPEVSYFENGSRRIPSAIITKAAKLFGVEEYDLFEADPEVRGAHLSFAFRAEGLTSDDLKQIADFKKIVLNYLSMKNALHHASRPS
jgi:transcriptional regulator with XRE-family HTH domain